MINERYAVQIDHLDWTHCERKKMRSFHSSTPFPHSSNSSSTEVFCIQRFIFLFRCSCSSLLDHIRTFRGKDKRINGKEKKTMYKRNKNHINRCVARIASYRRKPKRTCREEHSNTHTHTNTRSQKLTWEVNRHARANRVKPERTVIDNLFQSVAWGEVRTRSRIQLKKAKRFG